MKQKIIILILSLVFGTTWSYSQNTIPNDNILLTIQTYCLDSLETDTLVIKTGKKMGLGTVYYYFKINKNDNHFHIQTFNQEQHKEGELWVTNFILSSEHRVSKEDFMFLLESEMLNCKYHKNKSDLGWSYEVQNIENQNQTINDGFGYSLFHLCSLIKTDKPLEDYFCKSELKWTETTELIESYHDSKTKYDTIITEEITCRNGDFLSRKSKDTRNKTLYIFARNKQVTIDSSSNLVSKIYSYEGSETSFGQSFIKGRYFSYSITYDVNWNIKSVEFYKNNKDDKYRLISSLRSSSSTSSFGGEPYIDYVEYELKNRLGVFEKYKNYDLSNGKLELEYVTTKALGKTKTYRFDDNKKTLDTKIIDRKNKQIFIEFDNSGGVSYKIIYLKDKQDRITTRLEYSNEYNDNKLVEKIEYVYKDEIGINAEKHLKDMIEKGL